MSEKRISFGINVSIFVILTIFGVLLSLPLRLLLNTSYYNRNETVSANSTTETNSTENKIVEAIVVPLDHRKLKLCPRLEYRDRLKSVFQSDYDGNCTYTRVYTIEESEKTKGEDENKRGNGEGDDTSEKALNETTGDDLTENGEESGKNRQAKSVPVAGHILVTMLVISTIAALVEVLRIRFARDKDSSKAGSASSRKTSTVELSIQRRFLPRYPMKSQRSFEIQGTRPPPLIRRSSFPTQPSKQSSGALSGTTNNRISRRQSAESDEEIGSLIKALHHRTRLIRRH